MTYTNKITVSEINGMQMGSDAMIAAAAWVSTQSDEALSRANENPDDVSGLINYLIKHRHGTPFEHGSIAIYVHAPILVWREWHRHRVGFSYNEESARYKTLDPVFYIPTEDRPMFKVENWRAGRPKFLTIMEKAEDLMEVYNMNNNHNKLPIDSFLSEAKETYYTLVSNLKESYALAYKNYLDNLAMEIDPGLARDCLPVGIYSSCWVTCNPRSIMSFLSLRVHDPESTFVSYPLYEIDNAAQQLEEIFKKYWPITYEAFVKNGRVSP